MHRRSPIRRLRVALAVFTLLSGTAVAGELAGHPSRYLALHADDPVEWRNFDAGAVAAAAGDDRLRLLSVGYFACHWCHVMQRESFRNPEIAALINDRFIPFKIDRELEPALDDRLTAFAEATLGQAGWPLNVFVTPGGLPVYAALYTPPGAFRELLQRIDALWRDERERLVALASRIAAAPAADTGAEAGPADYDYLENVFVEQALLLYDDFQGGFGNQSKFPHAPQLHFLLDLQQQRPRPAIAEMLTVTLDAMTDEGLYDHVGGGFFRYTVDPGWNTPHFEKMLYDNAQLARVYLRAAGVLDRPHYAEVARRTLDFMAGEMVSGAGALVASFSAVDDRDVEGGYYLWHDEELASLFDERPLRVLRAYCGIRGRAVFEAGHHLRCSGNVRHVAANLGIDESEAVDIARTALGVLREARQRRGLPVDDKLLAGWNGLALTAFSDGFAAFGEPRYREVADGIRDYLAEQLWRDGRLARARAAGEAVGTASLEDYAHVAAGLWRFAAATGSEAERRLARQILEAGWTAYRDGHAWRFADSLLAPPPPVELMTDSPLPSPTASMAVLALEMGRHFDDPELRGRAADAIGRGFQQMRDNAFFLAGHVRALGPLVRGAADS